jgi:hypothetical protein
VAFLQLLLFGCMLGLVSGYFELVVAVVHCRRGGDVRKADRVSVCVYVQGGVVGVLFASSVAGKLERGWRRRDAEPCWNVCACMRAYAAAAVQRWPPKHVGTVV